MQRRLPSREHHKNNPAADLFTAIYSYLYPDKTPSVMDWQETVVVIIGIVVAIVAVRGIVRSIRSRNYSSCSSCSDAACPLRDIKERREQCTRRPK